MHRSHRVIARVVSFALCAACTSSSQPRPPEQVHSAKPQREQQAAAQARPAAAQPDPSPQALDSLPPLGLPAAEPSIEQRAFQERLEHGERVSITVAIEAYVENAVEELYEDGIGRWFDRTLLRVATPAKYAGRKIVIQHYTAPDAGSLWRDVGASYELTVPSAVFDRSDANGWFGPAIAERVQRLPRAAPKSK